MKTENNRGVSVTLTPPQVNAMSNSLVPIEQKQVTFYEDTITAVRIRMDQQELVYVPIRPICDYLGITYQGQRDRIDRDPVLREFVQTITIYRPETAGSSQDMICLALKYVPGWLFGINTNRVKSHLQDKILRYQRECYDVLWEAFQEGRLTADPDIESLLQSNSDAAQAYKMAMAVVKLARNQLLLESRLDHHDQQMAQYEDRLEQIEAQLGNEDRYVSADQASQISQAVKAVAVVMGKQSKRNEFGAVYGELYRKFGVTSYKQIAANKFNEVMRWLTDWYQSLTDEDVPF